MLISYDVNLFDIIIDEVEKYLVATSYDNIKALLDEGGFRYSITSEGNLLTGFGEMEEYIDSEGRPRLGVLIFLEESGNFVRFLCPRLYRYEGKRFKTDLLQSCLMINYWAKLLKFEFDDRDGEVRAVIELPLEDTQLSLSQLSRCLTTLAYLIDRLDPLIRRTLKEGGVHIPREPITF
jgi:hypothetical protein